MSKNSHNKDVTKKSSTDTTAEQLRNLENNLWEAADELRANSKLTAAEYKDPVLGLILLRFAENKFDEALSQLDIPINPRTGKVREITKDDFVTKILKIRHTGEYHNLSYKFKEVNDNTFIVYITGQINKPITDML